MQQDGSETPQLVKILQHLSQMWLIANLFILSAYFEILEFPDFIHSQSIALHQWCLAMVESTSPVNSIQKALVCAAPLPQVEIKELARATGIVHYFVVSGAHILILEKIYSQMPLPDKLRNRSFLVLLSFYCMVCNLSAPILRSFFYFLFKDISKRCELQWSGLDCLILAFTLTLALRPELWSSLSLQLSCSASAILLLKNTSMKQSALIYLGVCFYISGFGAPHPISILVNLVFAPIFALVHLPLTWLSTFLAPVAPVCDFVWAVTLWALQRLDLEVLPSYRLNTSFTGWLFLIFIFLIVLRKHIFEGQKRCTNSC